MCIRDSNKINSSINVKFDVQKNSFEEQNIQFQQSISMKFDELKTEINKVQINCESNCNKLKYELNETLSHAVKNMNNRVDKIESLSLIHI